MPCSINVKFSSESKKALNKIRELQGMANALSVFIGMSVMLDIFGGNGVKVSSYKIYTTDFELLANSMRASNPILVHRVRTISGLMYMKQSISHNERAFWRCLYNEVR